MHDGTSIKKHDNNLESEVSKLKPLDLESKDDKKDQVEEPDSLISFETMESPVQTKIIRQPSPPPVLAEIQDLIPSTSPAVVDRDCGLTSNADGVICAEAPLELHIVRIFINFLCFSLIFWCPPPPLVSNLDFFWDVWLSPVLSGTWLELSGG